MRVLVACECSGTVRDAFRARGFDAWSNDLKPCEKGGNYHIQGDCIGAMQYRLWDLIIMHPDCTKLSLSGNRHYGKGKPRHNERIEAIEWTLFAWRTALHNASYVALENPKSVIFPPLRKGGALVQYIQPHEYGHPEFKATGLALSGLPPLVPTTPLELPAQGSEEYKAWERVWRMPPGENRKTDRSRTYQGIADAMAEQWGNYILGGLAA